MSVFVVVALLIAQALSAPVVPQSLGTALQISEAQQSLDIYCDSSFLWCGWTCCSGGLGGTLRECEQQCKMEYLTCQEWNRGQARKKRRKDQKLKDEREKKALWKHQMDEKKKNWEKTHPTHTSTLEHLEKRDSNATPLSPVPPHICMTGHRSCMQNCHAMHIPSQTLYCRAVCNNNAQCCLEQHEEPTSSYETFNATDMHVAANADAGEARYVVEKHEVEAASSESAPGNAASELATQGEICTRTHRYCESECKWIIFNCKKSCMETYESCIGSKPGQNELPPMTEFTTKAIAVARTDVEATPIVVPSRAGSCEKESEECIKTCDLIFFGCIEICSVIYEVCVRTSEAAWLPNAQTHSDPGQLLTNNMVEVDSETSANETVPGWEWPWNRKKPAKNPQRDCWTPKDDCWHDCEGTDKSDTEVSNCRWRCNDNYKKCLDAQRPGEFNTATMSQVDDTLQIDESVLKRSESGSMIKEARSGDPDPEEINKCHLKLSRCDAECDADVPYNTEKDFQTCDSACDFRFKKCIAIAKEYAKDVPSRPPPGLIRPPIIKRTPQGDEPDTKEDMEHHTHVIHACSKPYWSCYDECEQEPLDHDVTPGESKVCFSSCTWYFRECVKANSPNTVERRSVSESELEKTELDEIPDDGMPDDYPLAICTRQWWVCHDDCKYPKQSSLETKKCLGQCKWYYSSCKEVNGYSEYPPLPPLELQARELSTSKIMEFKIEEPRPGIKTPASTCDWLLDTCRNNCIRIIEKMNYCNLHCHEQQNRCFERKKRDRARARARARVLALAEQRERERAHLQPPRRNSTVGERGQATNLTSRSVKVKTNDDFCETELSLCLEQHFVYRLGYEETKCERQQSLCLWKYSFCEVIMDGSQTTENTTTTSENQPQLASPTSDESASSPGLWNTHAWCEKICKHCLAICAKPYPGNECPSPCDKYEDLCPDESKTPSRDVEVAEATTSRPANCEKGISDCIIRCSSRYNGYKNDYSFCRTQCYDEKAMCYKDLFDVDEPKIPDHEVEEERDTTANPPPPHHSSTPECKQARQDCIYECFEKDNWGAMADGFYKFCKKQCNVKEDECNKGYPPKH